MTKKELELGLNIVFKTTFENNNLEITREMTADDINGWDSITHLDLIVAVENRFSIEINGFDVMGLKNVGDLADLVERKLAQ